jgi:hypothetical protein
MIGVTLGVLRTGSVVCAIGAVALLALSSSGVVPAARAADGQTCAGVPDGSAQTAPSPGHPCWVAADPYPFGTDGTPVDPTSDACVHAIQLCYLNVTSMAFRSWNRGLAATTNPNASTKNPFGIWLFNGTRWYPDPTFPGSNVCKGNTVLWAGKLDYWLIGTGQNGWAPLCRFDGSDFLWEPLPMPLGTVLRLGNPVTGQLPSGGGITSGSCLSWDNCWFFGTDDTVLHWDGDALTDVSPDAPARWTGTTFTAAQLSAGTSGSSIGLATVGTSYAFDAGAGIPVPTRASMPTQMFAFDGTTANGNRLAGNVLGPTVYHAPPAAADTSADPFGTDPVAVSLDPSGNGWLAANPAAWQVGVGVPFLRPDLTTAERSPLVPISTGPGSSTGPNSSCPSWLTDVGLDRFPHTYGGSLGTLPGSTLWTSISSFPGGKSAFAGGQTVSTLSDGTVTAEPAIVQASCDGTATVTRFRIPDPLGSGTMIPADEGGTIEAVAANAANDGWAATNAGRLVLFSEIPFQAPQLYRFTDGTAPRAPAGNDIETRAAQTQQDPATYLYKPPPPPKLPPLPRGSTTKQVPPAITGIHRKVNRAGHRYTLTLSFKVRRRVVMGLDAFLHNSLIASTGLKQLRPPSGQLQLGLSPKRWPTRLAFTSNTPQVALSAPSRLTGKVALSATAKPVGHTTIRSVQFQYELSGTDYWIVIGRAKRPPFRLSFDTTAVADGSYDLRAVATDSRGRTGISRAVAANARNARNARG